MPSSLRIGNLSSIPEFTSIPNLFYKLPHNNDRLKIMKHKSIPELSGISKRTTRIPDASRTPELGFSIHSMLSLPDLPSLSEFPNSNLELQSIPNLPSILDLCPSLPDLPSIRSGTSKLFSDLPSIHNISINESRSSQKSLADKTNLSGSDPSLPDITLTSDAVDVGKLPNFPTHITGLSCVSDIPSTHISLRRVPEISNLPSFSRIFG